MVKMDRERHASTPHAGGDEITFNKALYQRYLQRKENEENNTNRGNNSDKQWEKKKPVYQCYDEFEDESDDERTGKLDSSAAINSEQLSEFAEV
jgi:hypothetical protein